MKKTIILIMCIIMLLPLNVFASPNLGSVNPETIKDINLSYDELWLQEILEYEKRVGKIVDDVFGTDGVFLSLSISDRESDRKKFVHYVIENYNKFTDEQKNELNGYIIGYAEGVDDNDIREFIHSKKQAKNNIVLASSYKPLKAREYAEDYYYYSNIDEYPDLTFIGGDCANFVSQCIHYAGKEMDTEWYITKLNNDNNLPDTIKQFNESWDVADPSPWISAKEFGIYWSSNALHTKTYSVSDYLALSTQLVNGYATGDVVMIYKKAIINYYGYHTMLITKVDGTDYLYSGHTESRFDNNLTDALDNYTSSSYKIKFFAMY